MDIINDALETAVSGRLKNNWIPVHVNVAPATLTITSKQVTNVTLTEPFDHIHKINLSVLCVWCISNPRMRKCCQSAGCASCPSWVSERMSTPLLSSWRRVPEISPATCSGVNPTLPVWVRLCRPPAWWVLNTLEIKHLSDSLKNIYISTCLFSFQSSVTRNVWMPVHPAWPPACPLHPPTPWPDGWRKGCRACWAALRATGQALSPLELDLHSIKHRVHAHCQPSLTVPP